MWILFQFVNNFDQFNQSDFFKIEWKLHQFLSSILNQSDKFKSTVSSLFLLNLLCEQSFLVTYSSLLESHFHTSISATYNKNISCSLLLSWETIKNNNNDSHHSSNQDTSLINSVFFNVQMQMLCNMIVQIKNKNYVEDCVKMINSVSWCLKTTDLSHCSEQSYLNQWDLSQHCQYKLDSDNSDDFNDFNEFVSDLLNTFCRYCQTDKDIHFHSEEVSFFNSHFNAKDYKFDDIINAEEKIYFYDIYLFIDFFKNVIYIKTDEVVHCNLNKYLHNIAQNWYIKQLSAIKHKYIWKDQEVEH